jgi:hypothetical protein
MSLENAEKATKLAAERKRLCAAKWNCIVHDPDPDLDERPGRWGGNVRYETKDRDIPDEQLAWAIEEYRKRRIGQIDAQLRKLGFEPPQAAKDEAA